MKFKGTLFDHQVEAVRQMAKTPYSILAHDMGLGKSVTSLARACDIGKPTLIICPAYLRKKWQQEDVDVFTEGGTFKILSYNELVKEVMTLEAYSTVIVDEVQYAKNMSAQRTMALHNYILRNQPENLMLLSGTPIKNRVPEVFSLLQMCFYGNHYPEFKPYYRLYNKFCETFSNEVRFKVGRRWISNYQGLKNVDRLKKLIKPIYFRKKSEQVINLPKQNYNEILIKSQSDYDARLLKAYDKFEVNSDDPAFMTMKAANALAKSPATIELAKNILEDGNQVVIFTDHIASCQEIARQLKVTPIDGSVSPDVRSTLVDRFRKGIHRAIVATIGSLSTGVNLNCANYMIFNDMSYVPADLEQAEKRIHRIGQTKPCFYYYMLSSNIDRRIYRTIKEKMKVINEVNSESKTDVLQQLPCEHQTGDTIHNREGQEVFRRVK